MKSLRGKDHSSKSIDNVCYTFSPRPHKEGMEGGTSRSPQVKQEEGWNRTIQKKNRNLMRFEGKRTVICSMPENSEGKRWAGAACLLAEQRETGLHRE